MTGGRLTASSNDFTIGYARARRDLGCRYTIGFYDHEPEEDRTHRLRVESAVPGVTVHHAASYSFPSRQSRHAMAVQAAYMVPTMFEGGGMRAEVFCIAPLDRKKWDAVLAIDFPVPPSVESKGSVSREFGVVLMKGPNVTKRFDRRVLLQGTPIANGTASRRLSFLEPATLAPGRYTLTAVLSDPLGDTPYTAHAELTVPDIPSKRPFLVGPMMWRRGGPDVVIRGGEDRKGKPADLVGGPASFRPLIITQTDRSEPLVAFTEACVSKRDAKRGPWRVMRGLESTGEFATGTLDGAAFPDRDRSAIVCERYVDQVPVSRLELGAYTFSANLQASSPSPKAGIEKRTTSFLLVPDPIAQSQPVAPTASQR